VIALSQLSRAPEQRGDHRPQLSDLRESGSLEQDSDIVIFLYREGLHNPEIKRNKAELIISKHRNGPIGEVPLIFLETQTRFVNATRGPSPGHGSPPQAQMPIRPEPAPPSFPDQDEELD
jgi:replicative DNA helicase